MTIKRNDQTIKAGNWQFSRFTPELTTSTTSEIMVLPAFKNKLPSFWTVQIVGWSIYAVVIYITFLTVVSQEDFLPLFYLKTFRAFVGFCLTSFILRPVYKKIGGLSNQWIILSVIVLAILLGGFWTMIEGVYYWLVEAKFSFGNYFLSSAKIVLDYAMTITAWSALYFGVKSWWAWQQGQKDLIEAKALTNQAQLEMLRYQINPHFLFNSLNSIQGLIDEDLSRTKQMVMQLSEFLRYSLLSNREKDVPLGEELQAVRNYLAIEKIRFEDKLEISFEVDEASENFRVPCFLLNPLVENAIKHGFDKRSKLLVIHITARIKDRSLYIEVANSGSLKSNKEGTQVGLKNVKERLDKHFHGRSRFSLEEEAGRVRARIEISQS